MGDIRAHLRITGRVQGVAFRYSTRAEAMRLGLTGWVRNRRDRSVEAVVEGPEEEVEKLIAWCGQGAARSQSGPGRRAEEPGPGRIRAF